tara:strand:- start:163 stop:960 length:798 start_codon:yes stop_codon:yes gene_type:complete
MPTTSEKFETDYFFKKQNDSSPVVFIHGIGLNKEIWYPQINFFNNYSIITYDLIGHGKTPLKKNQINFQDFVKQLLNLIDELEIKKIHLVGFSLGALISRHFASEHGDRLNSLNLHASIYKRSIEQKRIVENRLELLKTDRPASKDRSIRRWFTAEYIKNNPDMYKKIYAMLDGNNPENFLKTYKLFVFYQDEDEMIKKINTNTLVSTGQNDVGSTKEMAINLSENIKNAKYAEIRNGKHLCNIECADEYNKILENFIDRNYDGS